MRRVWIVGGIAGDLVLKLPTTLRVGEYHQPTEIIKRPGGSGANVALALCTGPVETGFVTYIGSDPLGQSFEKLINESELSHRHIIYGNHHQERCLVILDMEGERTLIGLSDGSSEKKITLKDVPLEKGDVVVFLNWLPLCPKELEFAKSRGCITVVGLAALLAEPAMSADIAIGSRSDLAEEPIYKDHLHNFPKIVVTQGRKGATEYSKEGVIHQDAFLSHVVDTTGAGDSFLAGYLTAFAMGAESGILPLELGARWASLMVTIETSIPPHFSMVPGAVDLLARIKEPK